MFQSFDKDRSGKISKKEFKEILEETGMTQISGKLIDDLVETCDRNKDGEIDYLEFLETMKLNCWYTCILWLAFLLYRNVFWYGKIMSF